jgi:hypothetical protein
VTRLFDQQARAYIDGSLWPATMPGGHFHPRDLEIRPATVKAARPYVARFHYSGTMPDATREVFAGYYPGSILAGFVVFGMGAGKGQYLAVLPDLKDGEYRELTRLWSPDDMPRNTESRLIGDSLRDLRGVRLVLSYADPAKGHVGTVYQATNWLYLGMTAGGSRLVDENGQELHSRLLSIYRMRHPDRYRGMTTRQIAASLGWSEVPNSAKHRYAMLLGDRRQRARDLRALRVSPSPYPKNVHEAAA